MINKQDRIDTIRSSLNNIERPLGGWRLKLYTIIFEADTPAGKLFDVTLIWAIALSVLVVMADSVQSLRQGFEFQFATAEWIFTVLFTIEYIARLSCCPKPMRYATSFFWCSRFAVFAAFLFGLVFS